MEIKRRLILILLIRIKKYFELMESSPSIKKATIQQKNPRNVQKIKKRLRVWVS